MVQEDEFPTGCLFTGSLNSAKMKTILACLLLLAVSVPASNASCFIQPMNPGTSDGCLDSKEKLHPFGSRWRTDDCMDCECSRHVIQCCTSYATPVDYDEEKCEAIFNKVTCTYKVLEKSDHSKECPVHQWVG